MPSNTDASADGFDRWSLAFAVVFLTLVALWYATHPAQFAAEFDRPLTYALAVLVVTVLVVSAHRRLCDSWLFDVSLGVFVAVWGLHNLTGDGAPLVMGYGFVVLGVCHVGYAVYKKARKQPSTGV